MKPRLYIQAERMRQIEEEARRNEEERKRLEKEKKLQKIVDDFETAFFNYLEIIKEAGIGYSGSILNGRETIRFEKGRDVKLFQISSPSSYRFDAINQSFGEWPKEGIITFLAEAFPYKETETPTEFEKLIEANRAKIVEFIKKELPLAKKEQDYWSSFSDEIDIQFARCDDRECKNYNQMEFWAYPLRGDGQFYTDTSESVQIFLDEPATV